MIAMLSLFLIFNVKTGMSFWTQAWVYIAVEWRHRSVRVPSKLIININKYHTEYTCNRKDKWICNKARKLETIRNNSNDSYAIKASADVKFQTIPFYFTLKWFII